MERRACEQVEGRIEVLFLDDFRLSREIIVIARIFLQFIIYLHVELERGIFSLGFFLRKNYQRLVTKKKQQRIISNQT